jgi:transposase
MGCAMRTKLEDIYVEGLEFEPEVIAWMKSHSVHEIKALAEEVEEHGEDSSELREFYKELRAIEKDWAKHKVDGHYHPEHSANS